MGLFSRLRSASSASSAKDRSDGGPSPVASTMPHAVHHSPSNDLLAPPKSPGFNGYMNGSVDSGPYDSPARVSTSSTVQSNASTSTAKSRPFWKREKKADSPGYKPYREGDLPPGRPRAGSALSSVTTDSQSTPRPSAYRAVVSPASPQAYPRSPSIQTLQTPTRPPASPFQPRPATSQAPITPSFKRPTALPSPVRLPPAPVPQPKAEHFRTTSQSTIISLDSTITGRSVNSSESGAWQREGGILGKLNFEQEPVGALVLDAQGSPRALSRIVTNGDRSAETLRSPVEPDLTRQTSGDQPIIPKRSPMRKLATLSTPTLISGFQTSPLGETPTSIEEKENMEEITPAEREEEKRSGWGRRIRTRGSTDRPPSPTLQRRQPAQMESRPGLRRPNSSLFHNPFHRSQSRVSLVDTSPAVEEGSFQLKSFRHVSGASEAELGIERYLSMVSSPPVSATLAVSPKASPGKSPSSDLAALQRPRQLSNTGSIESASRVSMAAFRKGIRRPSSSMLGDDDDLPLSLSRANLIDQGQRSGSALSLTDMNSPQMPSATLSVPQMSPRPDSDSKRPSPTRSPIPPTAISTNFVVKGVTTSRVRLDDKSARSSGEVSVRRVPSPLLTPVSKSSTPPPTRPTTVYVPLSEATADEPLSLPPPPRPAQVQSPESEVRLEDLRLPPRPDELDEPFMPPSRKNPDSRPPSRGSPSTSLSTVLDDPIRRFSGLWGSAPMDNGKEEPFDPEQITASPSAMSNSDSRFSVYDKLTSVTSAATSAATTVYSSATSALNSTSSQKLFIPPVPTTPDRTPRDNLARSPSSDSTASPTRVPPAMQAPPAPPPAVPHSSFGRVQKKAEKPAPRKTTWDSSDEDDNSTTPPARAKLQSNSAPRSRVVSVVSTKSMEEMESEEEDMPLNVLRGRTSRQSLRPAMARSSRSSLKASSTSPQPPTEPPLPQQRPVSKLPSKSAMRPTSGHSTSILTSANSHSTITPSGSKWSLSSDSQTVSPSSDDAIRPLSRPSSRNTQRGGRRPPSVADMPRSGSSDKLRAPAKIGRGHPSPRHDAVSLVAANDNRNSDSPASSRSGLTGDSSTHQPMTPKSNDPSRRSWAEARPRHVSAGPAQRPQSQFDWAAPPAFPMDMNMNPQQAAMMKQQMQLQWMASAQRYFDDAWERASSVSNAQTAPGHGGMGGMSYGYSYNNMPPPPPAFGYPQMPQFGGFPYGGYPAPSVGFPGMPGQMPGMPGGMPGAMPGMPMPMGGMPGMPMGGMYSYAPPAQSVYGGEFGPPVAPFQQQPEPQPSPRSRARRLSSQTDVAGNNRGVGSSAASVTGVSGHNVRQKAMPRRSSNMDLAGPPSSWRRSLGAEEEPSPRKRVTNAS